MLPNPTVEGTAGLLNWMRNHAFSGTLVLPSFGSYAVMDGLVRSASVPVVKVDVAGAVIAFPLRSATPAIVNVNFVPGAKPWSEVITIVWLPLLSFGAIGSTAPLALSVMAPRVLASTGSLNWTRICAFRATPAAPLGGPMPVTWGADALTAVPVVNVE